MTTNSTIEIIEICCTLIDTKMKRLLEKYHNTNIKLVDKIFKYINKISIKYNVPEYDILNFPAYEWYYSNFLNALLTYMFVPWVYTENKELNHIQIHDLIFNIYKIVINKKCKYYVIDYYDKTFIDSLNTFYTLKGVKCNVKKYIPLLKIIFKYGSNLVNKQQQLIETKIVIIFSKRRALRIINNWVIENITGNPEHKICQKRIKILSEGFYSLSLEQKNKIY